MQRAGADRAKTDGKATDHTAALLADGDGPDARAALLAGGGGDPTVCAHLAGSLLRSGDAAGAARTSAEAARAGGRAALLASLVTWAVAVAAGRAGGPPALPPDQLLVGLEPAADATLVALTAGMAAVWAEAYDAADALFDALDEVGPPPARAASGGLRALMRFRNAAWEPAATLATAARDLAEAHGLPPLVALADAVLATVEAARGDAERCRQRALALLASPSGGPPFVRTSALSALGLLELGQGDAGRAAAWLEVLATRQPPDRNLNPGIAMWEVDLAEAYVSLGRRADASSLLDALAARAERSGNVRAGLAVTRCRAMLAESHHDATAMLGEVAAQYSGPQWAFARARTHLALGERHLAVADDAAAHEVLRSAETAFAELGARGWQARAASLLARIRPPGRASALSRLEARVATAAGLGSQPGEIAAGMSLPEAQVRGLLDAAMAKLGVAHVDDLASRVAELAAEGLGEPENPGGGSQTAPPALRVELLGRFAVVAGDRPLDIRNGVSVRTVKRLALDGPISADHLVDDLWPGVDRDTGRARLRSLLARLRRLAPGLVVRHGELLALGPGVEVDVAGFDQAASAALAEGSGGAARRVLDRYPTASLADHHDIDEAQYVAERVRRLRVTLLDAAAEDDIGAGRIDAAVAALGEAVQLEPFDDARVLRAAEMLLSAGRADLAMAALRRAECMRRDLGLPLPPRLEELRRAALAARPGPAERAAAKLAALPPEPAR